MIKYGIIQWGCSRVELQQLKYFKTVAQMGKISDAAQALFISAPALSTSISRLERELGMPLFDRTNNRIILNQQGKIFLRYVNNIFEDLSAAKTELRNSLVFQHRHVCIASVSSTQLVDVITAFSQEHPGFTLQCTNLNRTRLREDGFAIQHSFLLAAEDDIPPAYADKLDSVCLFEDQPVIMVHPDHPLAQKDSVELSELTNETIFLPFPDYPLYANLVKMFQDSGIVFPTGNAYSHLVSQQMVAKGLGVAFATKRTGRTPSLPLRYVPIGEGRESWISRLYWRRDHVFSEDERIFKEFVIHFFTTQQGE